MTRTKNPFNRIHKWPRQFKEQIVNETPYYRRTVIGNRLGWTRKQTKNVCVNRARMIMDFLQADWPAVKPVTIVAGSRHTAVYDRIYDWCVHELEANVPQKRWRCAFVRLQALTRRYLQRHTLNGHLKYSRGGFIAAAYKKRRNSMFLSQ